MKNKRVVIHQPDFLPYLGFFHRLIHCDTLVFLDNAQFNRGGSKTCWHNRDKIKTTGGEKWLTVSVRKASLGTLINKIKLSDHTAWRKNNLNLIWENYKKAVFFKEIFPYIETIYANDTDSLCQFNIKGLHILMDLFDLKIETRLASELNCRGKANDLVVDILKQLGADTYISGVGAKDYFKPEPFEKARIKIAWQNFTHPLYTQCHGEFIPFLSSIDLLFNCGVKHSRKILQQI